MDVMLGICICTLLVSLAVIVCMSIWRKKHKDCLDHRLKEKELELKQRETVERHFIQQTEKYVPSDSRNEIEELKKALALEKVKNDMIQNLFELELLDKEEASFKKTKAIKSQVDKSFTELTDKL